MAEPSGVPAFQAMDWEVRRAVRAERTFLQGPSTRIRQLVDIDVEELVSTEMPVALQAMASEPDRLGLG